MVASYLNSLPEVISGAARNEALNMLMENKCYRLCVSLPNFLPCVHFLLTGRGAQCPLVGSNHPCFWNQSWRQTVKKKNNLRLSIRSSKLQVNLSLYLKLFVGLVIYLADPISSGLQHEKICHWDSCAFPSDKSFLGFWPIS